MFSDINKSQIKQSRGFGGSASRFATIEQTPGPGHFNPKSQGKPIHEYNDPRVSRPWFGVSVGRYKNTRAQTARSVKGRSRTGIRARGKGEGKISRGTIKDTSSSSIKANGVDNSHLGPGTYDIRPYKIKGGGIPYHLYVTQRKFIVKVC